MEKYPKFKERGIEDQEMLEGLKKSFVVLCTQLKENIDSGKYDALVSDDTGGRIPTILLREIFKKANPNHEFKTLFVASGKHYHPKNLEEENQMHDYLKKGLDGSNSTLLVTQYIDSGRSLIKLAENLKSAGVEHVDASTVDMNTTEELIRDQSLAIENFYVAGIRDKRQYGLTEYSNLSSGISKSKNFNPKPMRLDIALENGERTRQEYMKFPKEFEDFAKIGEFDNFQERRDKIASSDSQINELDSVPLSDKEKSQIQENINNARAKLKQVAEEVFVEVWGENK